MPKIMRLSFMAFGLASITLFGCRTTESEKADLSATSALCSKPVTIQSYLRPTIQCADPAYFGNAKEADKRKIAPWMPCNRIERVDGALDLFGPSPQNTADSVLKSNYARIYFDWLIPEDRFDAKRAKDAIELRNAPVADGNPIRDTAMHRKVHELIAGAQHNIVMDIFLLGGSMGTAIVSDLTAAADRGVKVILLHDNVSKFVVANEMDPLWKELKAFSLSHPNFVAMDSNIRTPNRVSSLPAGLDRLSAPFRDAMNFSVAADGRSDHSKILLIDTLYSQTPDEYQSLTPKAMISSHNLVDSASSYYHDEAVVVSGPGAVSALVSYQSDLLWAFAQAKTLKGELNEEDIKLVDDVLLKIDRVVQGPTVVAPQGLVSIQPIEVSANDEVRNLDSGILPYVMAARQSIDLYGKIAYNWTLAIALKEAMARGVRVRIILDQQTTSSALLNAAFPYMIMESPRRIPGGTKETTVVVDGRGQTLREPQLPVKWFLPFRPSQTFAKEDRSPLAQEIHAKTIIVDGRWSLYGSTNTDTFTWAGGFREYSVWVDDPKTAAEASALFDRLWQHKFLTVSHSVWIGAETPDPEVLAYYADQATRLTCREGASCNALDVVQGGRAYREKGPFRKLVTLITQQESKRIRQVFPANIPTNAQGIPLCIATP